MSPWRLQLRRLQRWTNGVQSKEWNLRRTWRSCSPASKKLWLRRAALLPMHGSWHGMAAVRAWHWGLGGCLLRRGPCMLHPRPRPSLRFLPDCSWRDRRRLPRRWWVALCHLRRTCLVRRRLLWLGRARWCPSCSLSIGLLEMRSVRLCGLLCRRWSRKLSRSRWLMPSALGLSCASLWRHWAWSWIPSLLWGWLPSSEATRPLWEPVTPCQEPEVGVGLEFGGGPTSEGASFGVWDGCPSGACVATSSHLDHWGALDLGCWSPEMDFAVGDARNDFWSCEVFPHSEILHLQRERLHGDVLVQPWQAASFSPGLFLAGATAYCGWHGLVGAAEEPLGAVLCWKEVGVAPAYHPLCGYQLYAAGGYLAVCAHGHILVAICPCIPSYALVLQFQESGTYLGGACRIVGTFEVGPWKLGRSWHGLSHTPSIQMQLGWGRQPKWSFVCWGEVVLLGIVWLGRDWPILLWRTTMSSTLSTPTGCWPMTRWSWLQRRRNLWTMLCLQWRSLWWSMWTTCWSFVVRRFLPGQCHCLWRRTPVADDDAKDPASDEVFNAMARERLARQAIAADQNHSALSGLPKEEDVEFLDRQNITLVLSAMTDRAKDTRNGLRSNHIMQFSVPVSYAGRDRSVAWDAAGHLVPAAIENGESVLVHCLAGVRRGPVLTALILALLCNSSLEDALRTISGLRAVEPYKVWERKGGHEIRDWVRAEIGRGWLALYFPKTSKWMCSVRDHSAWHVVPEGANGPLCRWNQTAAKGFFKGETFSAADTREAWYYYRPFCTSCSAQLPASLKRLCLEKWLSRCARDIFRVKTRGMGVM